MCILVALTDFVKCGVLILVDEILRHRHYHSFFFFFFVSLGPYRTFRAMLTCPAISVICPRGKWTRRSLPGNSVRRTKGANVHSAPLL